MDALKRNLHGLKVLDFTRVLVGPTVTMMLADNGAQVIKVEKPFHGTDERHLAPILEGKNGFQSGYYMMINRGKKSIALDIKDPECAHILRDLIRWADLLVENFAPGVMDKAGFGYEAVKALNPGLIYCSMSVYGQSGPLSALPGYDLMAQSMSGLLWLTGETDGPPMRVGTAVGDVLTAGFSLGAIGMALYHREKTGVGQHIDMSMRDCLAATLETGVIRYTQSQGRDEPIRNGNHHATMAPYGVFNAGKGRYISLATINAHHWDALCTVMGKKEWGAQARFGNSMLRSQHKPEIIAAIESWLQSFDDVKDAVTTLQQAQIPACLIQTIKELCEDPQWLMRGNLVEVEDPVFGPVKMPGTPMRFSETSVHNPVPAPMLGEHTAEILKDILNLPQDTIDRIVKRCVTG